MKKEQKRKILFYGILAGALLLFAGNTITISTGSAYLRYGFSTLESLRPLPVLHLSLIHIFGIVHGQMKSDEKDEVMRKFVENEYSVLVATTVIDVYKRQGTSLCRFQHPLNILLKTKEP